jgi:hypothetical protein
VTPALTRSHPTINPGQAFRESGDTASKWHCTAHPLRGAAAARESAFQLIAGSLQFGPGDAAGMCNICRGASPHASMAAWQ